ncbi:transglutaminase domain-containing protein [Paenibacillus sp. G2S3]|uniref:transglutaminase domain-containing protein n=1 Tax=Paenibacillus sp. G2S3 TaxID=3047872 RepID=UPI0024C1948E|nr:transglutaminase domain-containing protein [Paenibacillus sp. G2S3]WHY21004.1 transglutaminase domain-containing protein [Paenibacillus sp. G2S3]
MEQIERKFQEKKSLAKARATQLFQIFEQDLTEEEIIALKYLYAYMPVNDLADYSGQLFLNHVRTTLKIRRDMPWQVPDHIFLHFVLPYRVNTENIEEHRQILHEQLAKRTSKLSMTEAILETNYWCHEAATYIGSDLRTISPLTMIRNARGRCGEESTLAVAALRSIGIPARQVYTPRWAHCDDNHAWVEAWAEGEWYFIGACEPEARLNQGWFGPPARRAMLINTRIFANYQGPEDITLADEWFTEINVLENYASTRTITVQAKDEFGQPVQDAEVQFQVYNMAEFFPIAILPTNAQGEATFKTGLGDLMIRAAKGGTWGEVKISVADCECVELVLNQENQSAVGTMVDYDMVPPPSCEGEVVEELSEIRIQRHNERLEEGISIRAKYEATFVTEEAARKLGATLGLPQDRVWTVLQKARGNSVEIAAFLEAATSVYGEWALRLLECCNDKDLIDTFIPTLTDHVAGALAVRGELTEEVFVPYILRPRVHYEMITPYRTFFQQAFTSDEVALFRQDPSKLVQFIDETWDIWTDLPNLKGKGTAVGTFELRVGDRSSLDIMFVSICRSLGIPARIHPIESKPQFMVDNIFVDAQFTKGVVGDGIEFANGTLILHRDQGAGTVQPTASYYENFTLARLKNGFYKTLCFPHGANDLYDTPLEVEQGAYRLTTGVRLKDGTVLIKFTYFHIAEGEENKLVMQYRQSTLEIPVYGKVERLKQLTSWAGVEQTFADLLDGKGAYVAWLEPEREPSKHLLRELSELKHEFDVLGAPIILVVGDKQWTASFHPEDYPDLPANTVFVRDSTYNLLPELFASSHASEAGFPHLIIVDREDQIRYISSGYKIAASKEAIQILIRV